MNSTFFLSFQIFILQSNKNSYKSFISYFYSNHCSYCQLWVSSSMNFRSCFFLSNLHLNNLSRIQMTQANGSSPTLKITCGPNGTVQTVDQSSILQKMCPLVVIFLQFSITSMFMWMLCEGIHLNNVLTVSVFKNHFKTWYFYILGWGKRKKLKSMLNLNWFLFFCCWIVLPFCITLSWRVVMFVKERSRK